jgi:hypothetical protein
MGFKGKGVNLQLIAHKQQFKSNLFRKLSFCNPFYTLSLLGKIDCTVQKTRVGQGLMKFSKVYGTTFD